MWGAARGAAPGATEEFPFRFSVGASWLVARTQRTRSPRARALVRRCFLLCYDICDDKRLRKVFKVCKGYGEHWQYSIFFAVLRPIDRVRLQSELEDVLNLAEDQVLILDLGEDEDAARSAACVLGQPLKQVQRGMVVV